MFLGRRATLLLPQARRLFSTDKWDGIESAIADLNKEMESVFGEPPPSGLADSANNDCTVQEPKFKPHQIANFTSNASHLPSKKMNSTNTVGLTHVGGTGEAQMVDVSSKETSKRTAVASCQVVLGKKVFDMVLANQMAKGDVLTVAKVAGINGAKQTSSLIPLCHNITLTHVRVGLMLNPDNYSVDIEGEAATTGQTGVEMEAMTAVTVAGLTVYDMCKAASKEIRITDVRLERKSGGKSGDWYREA